MPSSMKVLIVEDEALYRETLATMVSGLGYEVATAETGREALENVLFQGIDVLLLDVFLPDATAFELIPKLQDRYPGTCIVALTGHSCRELERRLRALGAAYYIAKPFQRAELERVFDHMAGRPGIQAGCRDDSNS
jgi:CheY-like chemotaxis protein